MGYTKEALKFQIPNRMKIPALDIFEYLVHAPSTLGILEFGVFGSVARRQARYNSDLDIAIVATGDLHQLRLYCLDQRCLDRTDVKVDVIFLSPGWEQSEIYFHKCIKKDYIPIWKEDIHE